MAATPLTVRQLSRTIDGTTAGSINDDIANPSVFFVGCDVPNGNSFPNITGQVFLFVKNTAVSGSLTMKVETTYTRDGYALEDMEETIGAGDEALVGPFTSIFNDSNGDVNISWSGAGASDGKVCAVRLNPAG